MNSLKSLPPDLLLAKELVFDQCGVSYSVPIPEAESADYYAYAFEMNGLSIQYRIAKITPTKAGQFVTLWKRKEKGPIQPFDISDDIDLFIVSTRKDDHFGQFIFSKALLHQKGVISGNGKEGKRAIRVYPPWDITPNKQAQKSQQWQLDYFLAISQNKPVDLIRAKNLLRGEMM